VVLAPQFIAVIWSTRLFKEIRGKRNWIFLGVVLGCTVFAVVFIVLGQTVTV